MEKVKKYKKIIQDFLEIEAKAGYPAQPGLKNMLIKNEENHFIMLVLGWHNEVFHHYIAYHFEVSAEGKIIIYENNSDESLVEVFIEKSVDSEDILTPYLNKDKETFKVAA
jgi:hypothetical protein